MTAALDLGSSEFRSLRRDEHRLIAQRIPAVYTVVPDHSANRKVLDQSNVPYSTAVDALVVIGEEAIEVSTLLSRPLIPILPQGQLAENDPIARQVSAWLIEMLLPPASSNSASCAISLPRGAVSPAGTDSATAEFLEHIVQLQGYQTEVLHPGQALALAELEQDDFSGIALTVGAESITLCITHLGESIFQARCLRGCREMLERYAHQQRQYMWDHDGNAYLDLSRLRARLASGEWKLTAPHHDPDGWLAAELGELLLSACFTFKRKLAHCDDPAIQARLPFVVSGGPAQADGFLEIVLEAFRLSRMPLNVTEARSASLEPYSVSRGLLIHATLAAGEALVPELAIEAA